MNNPPQKRKKNKKLVFEVIKPAVEKKDMSFKVRSLADNGTWRTYAVDSFKDAVLRYINDTNQILNGSALMIVKDSFDFAKVFKLAVSYDVKEIE